MTYQASCHCGAVALTVEGEIPTKAKECNCSHCSRKGFLMTFVPRDKMVVDRGEDALTSYRFNKKMIAHRFCSTCGVQPFGEGKGPDGSEMAMINLRCVTEADLNSLEIEKVNGADK